MFRQRSGSALCRSCGKLNRVDASTCFHCGARYPGLWGFGPVIGRLVGRLDFARMVTIACIAAYVAALLLDPAGALRPRGLFGLLSPSGPALDALGMTGALAWARGRWWTVLTAIYLHGGLLHILFNLLWINQLAPAVEQIYGRARLILIFTAAGVLGFLLSTVAGVWASVGASGSVFGLLGALVRYGQSRGGAFGVAVFRQYGHWALLLLLMGFLMPGVDNFAHLGGFAGGYLAGWLLGHEEHGRERGMHHLAASAAVILTVVAFGLALVTAFTR